MTGRDDEFDDFLARRRPLFRAPEQDPLEPPEEVDRIVLRQAREAIEARRGPREIRGLSWGMPLGLAATLLVAFTVILHVGTPKKAPVPEVTVETVAQRMDYPPAPAAETNNRARSADLAAGAAVAQEETARPAAASAAVTTPEWRHDARTWLAEIQRLRAAGRNAEADAELAEYKREHRAYAGSPDR
jgi:hypothetical protein